MAGQEDDVEGPVGDPLSDRVPVGQRQAEVALQRARDPGRTAQGRRLVQARLLAEGGQGLGGADWPGVPVAMAPAAARPSGRSSPRGSAASEPPGADAATGPRGWAPYPVISLDQKPCIADSICSGCSSPCKMVQRGFVNVQVGQGVQA
jgi:hypothetical protein